ncbi:BPSS1780 family membrane protein [Comamonas composti]|uniref:BPSS1780 family membrane protein n=1 Tax=Comamonas composti TaxID=408558 RepID=UPI0003F74826|nr:BPSS1780 family membrane protein [Comamonas composti]
MKLLIVPASTGLQWVKLGFATFRRQPLALTSLFFLYVMAISLLGAIPVVGLILALSLPPALSLAMMVAASEAAHGRRPTPALLLVAFRSGRERMQSMLTLCAMYTVGIVLIMLASALVDGGQFANVYMGNLRLTEDLATSPDLQAAMWLSMGLYLCFSLLFWHAPGLVHWHQVPPVKACFFSLVACVRNIGAFTVFGLGWMGAFLLAGLALTLLMGLLVPLTNTAVASGVMVTVALGLATVFFTSVVFSFRDCFAPPDADDGANEAGAQAPAAPAPDLPE